MLIQEKIIFMWEEIVRNKGRTLGYVRFVYGRSRG